MEVKIEGRYNFEQGPVEVLHRLEHFLGRINYKPGWVWALNAVAQDMVMVGVKFPIIDVTTGVPSMLSYFHKHPLYVYDSDLIMKDEYLLHLAHGIIRDAEKHESDEWFTFDGVKICDPHRHDEQKKRA